MGALETAQKLSYERYLVKALRQRIEAQGGPLPTRIVVGISNFLGGWGGLVTLTTFFMNSCK